MIDQWCCEASERITGDRNLWRVPRYDPKIGPWITEKETEFLLGDVTGHCEVMSPYLEHYGIKFGTCNDNARWLNAATGLNYSVQELRETAHRIRILVDSYNVLCARMIGEVPVAARPVETLFSFPQAGRPKDPAELRKVQEDYCRLRGYDPRTGVPVREQLEKLGMKDVADALESYKF